MATKEPIIFYDLPGNNPKNLAWSPNTWKTRYALNYKGLAYKTEWIEFPDIKATCIKLGGAPTSTKADGSPHYTLPMIYDPSTKAVVTDSPTIAKYLDETYPDTPALLPKGTLALQTAFAGVVWDSCGVPLFLSLTPHIWASLPPRSQEYFRTTHEKNFGVKLEEIGREEYWKNMEQGLGKAASWMSANGPGKDGLVLGDGDKISYADLQLAGILMWARTILGETSEEWQRIANWQDGKWKKYLEYFDKYATVDQ